MLDRLLLGTPPSQPSSSPAAKSLLHEVLAYITMGVGEAPQQGNNIYGATQLEIGVAQKVPNFPKPS